MTMTMDEAKARLRAAHAAIGFEGRFALTLTLRPDEEWYLTHWFRPTFHAFEDCKAVGVGTLDQCLEALDHYVGAYRRQPTPAEIGRTLGVEAPEPHGMGYAEAAE